VAPSAKVQNIEIANITSANNTVTADVSAWTGLTNANVVSTGGATITAANTTAVAATDSVLGAGAIAVSGGASATVTATKVNGGTINVGGVAGDVVVTAGAAAGAATATVGTVTVNGGKTITVTENLTASSVDVTKAVSGGNVNVTGSAATTTVSVKQTASAAATTSVGAIATGVVTIKDASAVTAASTIATATVDGYKTGSSVQSNALTSLTLANSDAAAAFTVIANNATAAAAPTTLKLTVNNAAGTLDLENAATAANKVYKTLNITTATKDSALAVTGSIVETLTIAGTNAIDLSSSSLAALKTVTVSGAAGVKGDFSTANVTSVDASATSGKNTVTVDATKATYKGGSGVDIVTLTAAAPTKAVTLGAGDDTIVLQSLATTTGVTIDGGTGTNTVQTTFALASSNADAHTELVNFSKLAISTLADASAGLKTIDLINFGTKSYIDFVLGAKTAAAGADLVIGSLDSNGTVEFNAANTGAGKVIVAVTNAASNTADVLNVKLNATANGAATAFDLVQAANVETVNVNSTTGDTTATKIAADINTLTLSAVNATAVTLTGNVALDLTGSTLTAVTKVDASAATGGVKVDLSGAAAAVTYLGGSSVDTVKLSSQANIVTLGGGKDVVDATAATSTATVFSTIKDIAAGDTINFAAVTKDITGAAWTDGAKLGAAITSPFGDIFSLLNAATASDGSGHALTWFQFGGDTYIVQDNGSAGTFAAGTDLLIKLTGIHDLTNSTLASAGGLTVV
jgi:S-layer protein